MQPNLDPREGVYVARQPILKASGQVYGYELLYRAGGQDLACLSPSDLAAARVLNDAVLTLGLETLTGGLPAFINMTRHLLLSEFTTLLSPKAIVVEVLETVEIDDDVVEACRQLHARGYRLALDDFVPGSDAAQLLPFASFVKIDVLATTPNVRRRMRQELPAHIKLVAEKVETADVHDEARGAGYEFFQGYYFCRPTTFGAGALTSRRLAYAQLLAALNQKNVTIATVEDLIKHDASLTYRVLRCVNSAAFAVRREVQSIRQALVLLGLDQVRKWASVWALAGLNGGASSELVTIAILRARCCELLAREQRGVDAGAEFFLLGLCSLLDAMLGRPMTEAVAELPVSASIRAALLGARNDERVILDAVIAYERGLWNIASDISETAGLSATSLSSAYGDALKWARELSQVAAAAA